MELKQWESCEQGAGRNEVTTWVSGKMRDVLYPSVDRTVVGMTRNFRSSEDLSNHRVEVVNWRLSGFGFGEKFGENGRLN